MSTNDRSSSGAPTPRGLWRLSTVAEFLGGISVRSVRRLIARGELPQPVHVGRSCCLPADEVLAYVERLKGGRK